MGRAQLSRYAHPLGHGVDANDGGRPFETRTGHGTEADWPESENRNGIADADLAPLRAGKTGGHDVRAHQHLFVAQAVGNRAQVGQRIRHQHVFGLTAIDGIAELPAAGCLEAVAGVRAIL
ncbi:hypothetical protein D3C86_1685110 [compost metagenome]